MLIPCTSSQLASICSKQYIGNSKFYTFLEKWGWANEVAKKIPRRAVFILVPRRTATVVQEKGTQIIPRGRVKYANSSSSHKLPPLNTES